MATDRNSDSSDTEEEVENEESENNEAKEEPDEHVPSAPSFEDFHHDVKEALNDVEKELNSAEIAKTIQPFTEEQVSY